MSRANKRLSLKKFIPEEYSTHAWIITSAYYFFDEWFTIKEIIFSIILNLTRNVKNKNLKQELDSWEITPDRIIDELHNFQIDDTWDILWWVYQSLLTEWEKNKKGSYYTPDYVVQKSINDYFTDWQKFIDPCCWTGQYLLNVPSTNPTHIRWADSDLMAVKIAKINLMIKYPDIDFVPNVYHIDSLVRSDWLFSNSVLPDNYFDLVATNPPRWAKIDNLYNWYCIKSWESFSYFIERWLDLLKDWWIMSYILPESMLNVKVHEDIREYLLKYNILSIHELWRIFTWVFTPAIRLDVKKNEEDWEIAIYSKWIYWIKKDMFQNNSNYTFSIHINKEDNEIIDKLYAKKAIFLDNNNSERALWIVTGNNKDFISDIQKDWYVPVYTGKEVKHFALCNPKKYLLYAPDRYQQIAPLSRYEAKPKLIYKFISNKLVFSLDNEWVFTLNSANIIVPKVDYPIKVIVALFNSDLYQTIFQKKFNSIKVLKWHIQELPLPILEQKHYNFIEAMVDEIIETGTLEKKEELDNYIFNLLVG